MAVGLANLVATMAAAVIMVVATTAVGLANLLMAAITVAATTAVGPETMVVATTAVGLETTVAETMVDGREITVDTAAVGRENIMATITGRITRLITHLEVDTLTLRGLFTALDVRGRTGIILNSRVRTTTIGTGIACAP